MQYHVFMACVISRFRREVKENCVLLGCQAVSSRLSRNVSKELPLLTA